MTVGQSQCEQSVKIIPSASICSLDVARNNALHQQVGAGLFCRLSRPGRVVVSRWVWAEQQLEGGGATERHGSDDNNGAT